MGFSSVSFILVGAIFLRLALQNIYLKFTLKIGNSNIKFPNKKRKLIMIERSTTAISRNPKSISTESEF